MKHLLQFYKIDSLIPEFKDKYIGFFVMDSTDTLYLGLPTGWQKIIYRDDLFDYYTKDESKLEFYKKSDVYNKVESDEKYYDKESTYSKSEAVSIFYTKTETDNLLSRKMSHLEAVPNPDFTSGEIEADKYYIWGTVPELVLDLKYTDEEFDITEEFGESNISVYSRDKNNANISSISTTDTGPNNSPCYTVVGRTNNVGYTYDTQFFISTSKTWSANDRYRISMKVKANFDTKTFLNVSTIGQSNGLSDKYAVPISDAVFMVNGVSFGTASLGSTTLPVRFGLQTGTSWLYRTSSRALYQFNSGNRKFAIDKCQAGDVITVNVSTALTPYNATLKSTSGNNRTFVVNSDGAVSFDMARNQTLYSINIQRGKIGCEIQGHTSTGNYVSGNFLSHTPAFTNEWTEYTVEGMLPENCEGMQTFAFSLNLNKELGGGESEDVEGITYYIADLKIEEMYKIRTNRPGTTVHEYMFQFTSPDDNPTTLILPAQLKWYSNPVVRRGRTYQCTIINNLAVLGEFI